MVKLHGEDFGPGGGGNLPLRDRPRRARPMCLAGRQRFRAGQRLPLARQLGKVREGITVAQGQKALPALNADLARLDYRRAVGHLHLIILRLDVPITIHDAFVVVAPEVRGAGHGRGSRPGVRLGARQRRRHRIHPVLLGKFVGDPPGPAIPKPKPPTLSLLVQRTSHWPASARPQKSLQP